MGINYNINKVMICNKTNKIIYNNLKFFFNLNLNLLRYLKEIYKLVEMILEIKINNKIKMLIIIKIMYQKKSVEVQVCQLKILVIFIFILLYF